MPKILMSAALVLLTTTPLTLENGKTAFDLAQKNDKLRGSEAYERLKAASNN